MGKEVLDSSRKNITVTAENTKDISVGISWGTFTFSKDVKHIFFKLYDIMTHTMLRSVKKMISLLE